MELTQRQAKEYKTVDKKRKGEIVTWYCMVTGISRNLASKRFRKAVRDIHPRVLKTNTPANTPRGRAPTYLPIHDEKGRVIRKKHDSAKTAYRRLMAAKDVSKEAKKQVEKLYTQLNLIALRRESETIQQALLQTIISRK